MGNQWPKTKRRETSGRTFIEQSTHPTRSWKTQCIYFADCIWVKNNAPREVARGSQQWQRLEDRPNSTMLRCCLCTPPRIVCKLIHIVKILYIHGGCLFWLFTFWGLWVHEWVPLVLQYAKEKNEERKEQKSGSESIHKTNTFTVKENNVHATPAHGCFPTLLVTYHPNRQPHYPHGKAGRQDKYTNHDYIFAFY